MPKAPKNASILWFLLFILVSTVGYSLVGYHWKRTQAGELILTFGGLFLMYALVISQKWDKRQTQNGFGTPLASAFYCCFRYLHCPTIIFGLFGMDVCYQRVTTPICIYLPK